MSVDDSEYDFPHVASSMNTLDAAGSGLDEDGKGGYCFDRMAFKDPFDILGFALSLAFATRAVQLSLKVRKSERPVKAASWYYRKKQAQQE
jgi:hypothetical protein